MYGLRLHVMITQQLFNSTVQSKHLGHNITNVYQLDRVPSDTPTLLREKKSGSSRY